MARLSLPGITDEEVRKAVSGGGRTYQIAKRLGVSDTSYMLRRLKKLEARGDVYRDDRYTFANSIYWGTF